MMKAPSPKLFISYSWTTPEYEDWVLNTATELRQEGVDVILDKWDLREGDDANAFMERMVTDENVKKVLIISDKKYAEKANSRSGGVGTETQIISAKVYASVEQTKFVVAIAEKGENGEVFLPAYYQSRIYIDLSNDERYIINFNQLLRWIYDKPLHIKPELGKPPSFLEDSESISLGTAIVFKRSTDAIKNSKSYASGATTEYFETFASHLENSRLESSKINIDYSDAFLKNIEKFLPYRNQIIELIINLSKYNNVDISSLLYKLFESLIPYMSIPEHINSCNSIDFDNYKFIIQEMFLYCITILLKNERFQEVSDLIQQRYFMKKDSRSSESTTESSSIFCHTLNSLERRNERMQVKRTSIHSDLLKDRCIGTGITFEYLMQSDFLLFIVDSLQSQVHGNYQKWQPQTLVYLDYRKTFEIFAKGESKRYFNKIKCIFDVEKKEDFFLMIEAFKQGKLHIPRWNFTTFNPSSLMGYENLNTHT